MKNGIGIQAHFYNETAKCERKKMLSNQFNIL